MLWILTFKYFPLFFNSLNSGSLLTWETYKLQLRIEEHEKYRLPTPPHSPVPDSKYSGNTT